MSHREFIYKSDLKQRDKMTNSIGTRSNTSFILIFMTTCLEIFSPQLVEYLREASCSSEPKNVPHEFLWHKYDT